MKLPDSDASTNSVPAVATTGVADSTITATATPQHSVVFAVRLGDDGGPVGDAKFLRLPPPPSQGTSGSASNLYRLRFLIDAGSRALDGGSATLRINHPLNDAEPFCRDHFHALPFDYNVMGDGARVDVVIRRAGAFEFYVERDEHGHADASVDASLTRGYFIVDPNLPVVKTLSGHVPAQVHANGERACVLNMDAICLQTVVPKWIGPLSDWPQFFRATVANGYNMVHFVPLQQRGASNSPYSIYDQLQLSDDLFGDQAVSLSDQQKYALLEIELRRLHHEDGILSVTDIVWNHTAHNSLWLEEHPEAGYNLVNSPHLTPAYELDEAIMEFSRSIAGHGVPSVLRSEDDLTAVMHVFEDRVLAGLRLWEFYVLDVAAHERELVSILDRTSHRIVELISHRFYQDKVWSLPIGEQAALLRKEAIHVTNAGMRFAKCLRMDVAFPFVCASMQVHDAASFIADRAAIVDRLRKLCDEMNVEYYREFDKDRASIVENVRSRCRFERLADHGPKMGAICGENPLVSTYFTRIPRTDRNHSLDVRSLAVVNNGWIWNADPLVDFASPASKSYLVREVIPWGDCVKLRYGRGRDDNPWLWDHIATYTKLMATYFHGFRIDNCHSTPIHVAQYFLDMARLVRPDLYVVAELFTGSPERDVTFVSKLGINSLIREAMNAWDAPELSRLIHSYGGQPVGSIALRSDYLPLELVGHTPADVTTPMADKFNQQGLPWNEPLYTDLSNVKSPAASRRTPSPILTNKVTHYRRKTGHHHEHDRYPHPCEYPESLYEVVFSHRGSAPHALFMDCTHDNETPLQKRIGEDTLCTGALLCMANCAVGSVRGYDELVPKHLNVVQETRRYRKDTLDLGIGKVKAVLQRLHYLISQKGYSEVHVHQEREFISVNRQNPFTHHGYLLIANTAFRRHDDVGSRDFSGVPGMNIDIFIHRRIISQVSPIVLRNSSFKTILAARIRVHPDRFERDPNTITGVPCDLEIAEREPLPDMVSIESGKDDRGHFFSITPRHFPCGSVLLLELDLLPDSFRALDDLKASLNMTVQGTWYLDGIIRTGVPGLKEALAELTLLELNVALYRCEDEERDFTSGQHGVYHVPGHGPLAYAGLQGIATVLRGIARANNLGHPMCEHLRQGMWLGTYTTDRLKRYAVQYPSLFPLIDWLDQRFALVRNLPSHLTPKYFNIVVLTVWNECVQRALQLMRPEFKCDTWFTRMLAMGSVQMLGETPSAGLHPTKSIAGLAAGLPHFAKGHMRCWGRDLFISLRGLLLVTGRFAEAREHLLALASVVRHGLIPNLLDSGRFPRYNARDATWFFLQALQDYCTMTEHASKEGHGVAILDVQIARRFPSDEFIVHDDPAAFSRTSTLRGIVHEIMERHAQGIHFREYNAGPALDHAMRSEGFQIDIEMDRSTGFVHGGNRWNCGTWMDKMGDSDKAGTKGMPATPRDGAAVEIVGLCKSTVRWLAKLADDGKFPRDVKLTASGSSSMSYCSWNDLIQTNFERCFYVPMEEEDDGTFDFVQKSVHRRGIYKDTYRSTLDFTDYQLRPNFPIAMVVAPELFKRDHALQALHMVKTHLLGPLGLKTLDPSDHAYRGDYDNANDSNDATVAHGFNYHQGPEWLWVTGYFLRAMFDFQTRGDSSSLDADATTTIHEIQRILRQHKKALLETNPYAGLPELTNSNGQVCPHSCVTQAWSFATLLDLMWDMGEEGAFVVTN